MSDSVTNIDKIQLARYLEARIVGFKGPIQVEQFVVGRSNPTFLIKAQSGNYVLRRQPPGPLLKSAHAVDREYRVIEALGDTDVPVPRAHHLSRDLEVIGSMFYVMSFKSGRIFSYQALPELDRQQRLPLYDEMIRVLGALHNLNPEAIGLGDYGRPGVGAGSTKVDDSEWGQTWPGAKPEISL